MEDIDKGRKEVGDLLARRAGLVKGIAPKSSKWLLTYMELKTLQQGRMPKEDEA